MITVTAQRARLGSGGARGLAWLLLFAMPFMGYTNSQSVQTASGRRSYELTVPSHLEPGRSYPLVVLLHGLGSNPAIVSRYQGLSALVDSAGFLLAVPEGAKQKLRGQRYWNATDLCCAFNPDPPDDVAFLDAVIDEISGQYRVDAKRIFVMGHSNGGYMAHRYACDRASRVAAIISIAGAMWTDVARCRPTEPVAVLQIHGDADPIVPYEGEHGLHGVPSAHTTVSDWVQLDHCAPEPDVSAPPLDLISNEYPPLGRETRIERWSSCRGVELWTMQGGNHKPRLQQPRWAETLYAWLAAHPKP